MTEEDVKKYLPITEFVSEGYLQEVNRIVLHPAGLALAITVPKEGDLTVTMEVWDYREDPEGMLFSEGEISQEKITKVIDEVSKHVVERSRVMQQDNPFGYIQKSDTKFLEEPND